MSSTGSVPAAHTAPTAENYASPPVTIILTVILLIFFFVGFFSIYFCRCFMQNLLYTWHIRHSPAGTPIATAGPPRAPGLDSKIIESFPTFTYSSVKDYRKEKYGLECAICLIEFGEEDMLRLLTSCCHVFHQECIDLWLESHKTCPVCRRSLDMVTLSPDKSPMSANNNSNTNAMPDINENEFYSIDIKDDVNEDHERGDVHHDQVEDPSTIEKFSRCKSTGHSIVSTNKQDEDRYTLRLPEHIKAKIIKGHNPTRSCTTFGELQTQNTTGNGGFGEVSGLSTEDIKKVWKS